MITFKKTDTETIEGYVKEGKTKELIVVLKKNECTDFIWALYELKPEYVLSVHGILEVATKLSKENAVL